VKHGWNCRLFALYGKISAFHAFKETNGFGNYDTARLSVGVCPMKCECELSQMDKLVLPLSHDIRKKNHFFYPKI